MMNVRHYISEKIYILMHTVLNVLVKGWRLSAQLPATALAFELYYVLSSSVTVTLFQK